MTHPCSKYATAEDRSREDAAADDVAALLNGGGHVEGLPSSPLRPPEGATPPSCPGTPSTARDAFDCAWWRGDSPMTTTVPPLRRTSQPLDLEHYPIAAASSARVLDAEGHARAAETVRQVASHIVAASPWPAEVCMCAVVPCTQTNWTHPGHCCRNAGDHADLFNAAHRRVCAGPNHTRGPR